MGDGILSTNLLVFMKQKNSSFSLISKPFVRARWRIGSRGSPLALAQANEFKNLLLLNYPDLAADDLIEIIPIKTTGDKIQDRDLANIGGKGLFTKEIEEALLANQIDFAVHSMKDVPTFLPEGLEIPCLLPRRNPLDAWFSRDRFSLADLPSGCIVGTSSLRRKSQILAHRPDLIVVSLRGNVQTRLEKLKRHEIDATVLALAGLERLNLADQATHILSADEMLPAVAQGAIGIEIRKDDQQAQALLQPLNDWKTTLCIQTERACLKELDGSCRTPIAALAQYDEKSEIVSLRSMLAAPDGSKVVFDSRQSRPSGIIKMGEEAGKSLRERYQK